MNHNLVCKEDKNIQYANSTMMLSRTLFMANNASQFLHILKSIRITTTTNKKVKKIKSEWSLYEAVQAELFALV